MNFLRLFLWTTLTVLFITMSESRPDKHNILQLCSIVNAYTSNTTLIVAALVDLEATETEGLASSMPVCQQHDNCYDNITFGWLQSYLTVTYSYTRSGGTCNCTEPRSGQPYYDLCQCDVRFGQCLSDLPYTTRQPCN